MFVIQNINFDSRQHNKSRGKNAHLNDAKNRNKNHSQFCHRSNSMQ